MEAFAAGSDALRVSAESFGGDSMALFHVVEMLPTYFKIQATITMEKPTAGWKANLIDINGPDNPISVAGNLTLLKSLTNAEESETLDSIGITLWNGNKLWFSSNCAGTKSIEQLLAKGNIAVHN